MLIFNILLIVSVFLCSLVAGFLFAYAVVVMPGIKNLNDKEFIKAFQVTDRVIQDNHPLFLFVWVGSAIALILSVYFGYGALGRVEFILLLIALIFYLAGVQVLTIIINLPLNNKLQKIDVNTIHSEELKAARNEFELRWNKSNQIRTAIACDVTLLLIILVFWQ